MISDEELREIWRKKGGSFHGPNIETGTMPESILLPWLRELIGCSSDDHTHKCIRCGHDYTPKPGESEDCPRCLCDGTTQ